MELVKQGYNLTQIAQKLGYAGKQGAGELIKAALKQLVQVPAEDVRKISLARLDHWLTKLEKRINKGDLKAIQVALKIEERRARLLGLDAPVTLQNPNGKPVSFLVVVPAPTPSIEDWHTQAREIIDVTPEPLEITHEPE